MMVQTCDVLLSSTHHHLISGYNNIFIRPFMCEFYLKSDVDCGAVCMCVMILVLGSLSAALRTWCGRFDAWMQFAKLRVSWGKTAPAQTKISLKKNTLDSECHTRGFDSPFFALSLSRNTTLYYCNHFHAKQKETIKDECESKKRCWLCNQVYFMLFRSATSKKKYMRSTSFPL